LKDIILHSRANTNKEIIITVQLSRFRKILSDIRCLNGLYVDGFIDRVCKEYDFFSFYSNDIGDKNNNLYTIIKDYSVDEQQGRCKGCTCGEDERWINSKTGMCFYMEDITNNYTTKIPE